MTHQDFVGSEHKRQRYWARSVAASDYFSKARPNQGHRALATLEEMGVVDHIITQNVDRLHRSAGSKNVLEMHGHIDGVQCLSCKNEYSREKFHEQTREKNSLWIQRNLPRSVDIRADGDANLTESDFSQFTVPSCGSCDGILMPTIVFFGGSMTDETRNRSFEIIEQADKVLVVGTSLAVWSAFRLCKHAHELGKPLGIINIGETRADTISSFKCDQTNIGALLGKLVTCIQS